MRNITVQDRLTFHTLSPEERLTRAIKFEESKQTTKEIEKINAIAPAGATTTSNTGRNIKP